MIKLDSQIIAVKFWVQSSLDALPSCFIYLYYIIILYFKIVYISIYLKKKEISEAYQGDSLCSND